MMRKLKKISLLCMISAFFTTHTTINISFIVPFLKTDPLANFLRDILVQQFFATSEFILISNNYDESQLEEIKRYASNFFNIKCAVNPDPKNTPALFNHAFKLATKPYITIMKIGDYRDPHYLARQQQELENHPEIDLVYSDYCVTWINQGFANVQRKWYQVNTPEFVPWQMSADAIGVHNLWRSNLHERFGYFMESLMYEYQWEFWNRCASQGAQFKKMPGIAGNRILDYFDFRQIFPTPEDIERGYAEDNYVRNAYHNIWEKKYELSEKPFVIVIPSYNNKNWYKRNLDSAFTQKYTNFRIIFIDDCSPDNTGQMVVEYVKLLGKEDKITVILNKERVGALANIYNAVHMCQPHEIIVNLDGDDWLAHPLVLNHLNALYNDPDVWLTYGQFQWWPKNVPGFSCAVPLHILEEGKIREYGWVTSALRTYYAGLFQKIKKEDLLYENKFFPMAWDLAIMFPMIEMAGPRCRFINEILYIYNTESNINDHKVNGNQQVDLGNIVRGKPRYSKIDSFL
ncbi:MAG: hypothetical protein AMXMBFR12_06850 [Candidatus Babeliales bacterium]